MRLREVMDETYSKLLGMMTYHTLYKNARRKFLYRPVSGASKLTKRGFSELQAKERIVEEKVSYESYRDFKKL